MNRAPRLAAVVLLALPAVAQSSQWAQSPVDGRWFGLDFAPRTWPSARSEALATGARLATVRSASEQAWLASTLLQPSFVGGPWIGLNDVANEGAFAWDSGEAVVFTAWAPGLPNDPSGELDAVALEANSSGAWVLRDLSDALPAAYERATPPPRAWSLAERHPIGWTTYRATTGDWNGDGRADAAAAASTAGRIALFLSQSDGTLLRVEHTITSSNFPEIAAGRFGGGPGLDLVHTSPIGIRILFGDGAGGILGLQDVAVNGGAGEISIADFDLDGLDDVAVQSRSSLTGLQVFFSSLGFASGSVTPLSGHEMQATAGDLDNDGDPDLVTNVSGNVQLLFWDGVGFTLVSPASNSNVIAPILTGDLDGDGMVDLALPIPSGLRIARGLGAGAFDFDGPILGTPWQPNRCAIADVDGDGRLDLSAIDGASAAVWLARPGGTFAPVILLSFGFPGAGAVCLADLAGTGRAEIVALSQSALIVVRSLASDCDGNGIADPTDIDLGAPDCDGDDRLDACQLASGGTSVDCDENGVLDTCDLQLDPTADVDIDGLLDACEAAGSTFCAGDGSATACPCGNPGASGAGCANSTGVGARLVAMGHASVSIDTVTLRAEGLPASANALFFQGSAQAAGGAGAVFGDGLRCAAGTVVRLATRTASAGELTLGHGVAGDSALSVVGTVPSGGGNVNYQVWYRNAAAFCTAATFNLSNGVLVTWLP